MAIKQMFAVTIALAALASSCGDDDTGPSTSEGGTSDTSEALGDTGVPDPDPGVYPVEVALGGQTFTVAARPERIVSLSPVVTEMLFAIGAGDQVAAADSLSNYPPDAPATELSAFEPNVEAIIDQEPDLVVLTFDPGDVVAGLEAAGVTTIMVPTAQALTDTYSQLEVLGVVTDHVGDAAEVVAQMQTDIEALVASVPERDEPLTYYHELDDLLFTITSQTFIGEIYALAGLTNVADAADADGAAGGYPQLSAEYLVSEDPDLIFLADTVCCSQTAQSFAGRPGFEGLGAVANGNVVELNDDIASRWGPRVVDFLEAIVEAAAAVPAPAPA